jgi:hypothetical protein
MGFPGPAGERFFVGDAERKTPRCPTPFAFEVEGRRKDPVRILADAKGRTHVLALVDGKVRTVLIIECHHLATMNESEIVLRTPEDLTWTSPYKNVTRTTFATHAPAKSRSKRKASSPQPDLTIDF